MQKTTILMKMYLVLLPAVLSASALQAVERPNLLFVYTDDQRYDAMSVVQREQGERGRFPWFRTPPKFTGWIERARLFSGEYKPEKP
jgi:hypothetical protein